MLNNKRIGFIGAGNMGEALIRGLLKSKSVSPQKIIVSDINPRRCAYIKRVHKVKVTADSAKVARASDVIIIAVKPYDIVRALGEIRDVLGADKLVISIAAGVTARRVEKLLAGKNPVVRAMPNTPALIGAGITAVVRGRFARTKEMQAAEEIFSAVGDVIRIQDEDLMDAVTALSGSGPAYFFYIIEAFLVVGIELGLEWKEILKMASSTALGSAKLLMETKLMPQVLRQRVTSKGGTTEAAMKVFQKRRMDRIIREAVLAAARRSKELAQVT